MKRVELKHIPLRVYFWDRFIPWVPRLFLASFLVQYFAVTLDLWMGQRLFGQARWTDGLLVVLATGSLLASCARTLPAQNVIFAATLVATLGSALHTLGTVTGVPFGPIRFTDRIGQVLFHPLPWAIPLLWIILIFSSRGVARLIMRRRRGTKTYGFWVMGITTALVLALVAGLEPFATRVEAFWLWQPSRARLTWYDAPWVNFLGWTVSTLVILAFVTPLLINKRPGKSAPPDYPPLAVWLLIQLLFLNGALVKKLWPAVAVASLTSLLVIALVLLALRKTAET
jgi:uncharacterized membrane protein